MFYLYWTVWHTHVNEPALFRLVVDGRQLALGDSGAEMRFLARSLRLEHYSIEFRLLGSAAVLHEPFLNRMEGMLP